MKHSCFLGTLGSIIAAMWPIHPPAAGASPPATGAALTAPVARIEPSLTRGVAPFTVLFDAMKSTPAKGKILEYFWDFGDEGPGNPRTETGWLAAHRFTKPGQYEVKLRFRDEGGGEAKAAVTITVLEWRGMSYHFSSSEGDDGRTAEQAQDPKTPWKTLDKMTAELAKAKPGARYLLKRGDSWDVPKRIRIPDTPPDANNPVLIGAYGEGNQPVLRMGFTGDQATLLFPASRLIVQDLHLQGLRKSWAIFYHAHKGGVEHLALRNLTIEGFDLGIYPASETRGNRFIFVEDCRVYDNARWGWLGGSGDHFLFRGNEFHHNGTGPILEHNIYFDANAVLFEDNHIHHASGIGINTHNASDIIIRRNDLHDNGRSPGGAIGISWNAKGDVIRHILIERNNFHENFLGMWLIQVEDLTVRNNLFRNQDYSAAAYQGMHGLQFLHNTFCNNKSALLSESSDRPSTGILVANNIFSHDGAGGLIYARQKDERDLSNMEWRNNLYHYAGANEGKAASFGSRVITQKALVEAVADAGAVYGDPLFVDANQGDFRLKRSSPAIDRGCDVPWVTNDMKGTSRPQSARPDIGAFEFVDAPAPR